MNKAERAALTAEMRRLGVSEDEATRFLTAALGLGACDRDVAGRQIAARMGVSHERAEEIALVLNELGLVEMTNLGMN